jgi:hypothetical protein
MMKERPILFNAEMVNAVRADRKTQTRRIVKSCPHPNTERVQNFYGETWDWLRYDGLRLGSFTCPYGKIGDQIWVRETFRITEPSDCGCSDHCNCNFGGPAYRATSPDDEEKWTPSIHMPRCASRIQLEITGVRVERLNDISEEDAAAEGLNLEQMSSNPECGGSYICGQYGFLNLWESIYGADSWKDNPWVWVLEFEQIKPVSIALVKGCTDTQEETVSA